MLTSIRSIEPEVLSPPWVEFVIIRLLTVICVAASVYTNPFVSATQFINVLLSKVSPVLSYM